MSSLHYIAVARIADCTRIAALATPEGGISRDVLEEKAQKVVQSGRIHQHVRLTIADNQVGRIHYHSDPAFLYIGMYFPSFFARQGPAANDGGLVSCFVVVTAAEYPQRMAFKVLSEVRHLFQHHFSDDMGLVKSCALLSKRAREPLLKIVAKYSDVTNVDKVAGVNVQVQQVKSLMQDNIQSALKVCKHMFVEVPSLTVFFFCMARRIRTIWIRFWSRAML